MTTPIPTKRDRRGHSLDAYRACADAGMTRAEAAKHLGVTLFAVNKTAARNKLIFRGDQKDTAATLRRLAASGATAEEAAESVGYTLSAVYRVARRGKFRFRRPDPVPPPAQPPRQDCQGRPAPDGLRAKALRMHAAGYPPGVIADYTGLSRGDVVRLVERIAE